MVSQHRTPRSISRLARLRRILFNARNRRDNCPLPPKPRSGAVYGDNVRPRASPGRNAIGRRSWRSPPPAVLAASIPWNDLPSLPCKLVVLPLAPGGTGLLAPANLLFPNVRLVLPAATGP